MLHSYLSKAIQLFRTGLYGYFDSIKNLKNENLLLNSVILTFIVIFVISMNCFFGQNVGFSVLIFYPTVF